jgi:hypothetical protein
MARKAKTGHSLIVLPWLRRFMQRFVLPNWAAISIGRWIFAWRDLDPVELAHELKHVEQWRRYGLKFIPMYLRESSRAAREGGHRYFDNQFEKEAVAAAEKERQRLLASEP